ncbi:MAG TPA: hypothetical protein VFA56_06585 [Gaiellaceae bacterium]|nr:hypothetical protein [Gaiellaceae bacterium]
MKRFLAFWWDFVVGDDWIAAALVVVGIAVTALLAAWWVMPVAFAGILTLSLRRATR